MFGSNVLEIGIGLVLTYLCISLVVTACNELIATMLRSRARNLERGIANLLDGKTTLPKGWENLPEFRWTKAFFDHQLVNALSTDGQRPSYVPSHTFATTLMHMVTRAASSATSDPARPVAQPAAAADSVMPGLCSFDDIQKSVKSIQNQNVREALLPLIEAARADTSAGVAAINKLNEQIEIWFDHTMDRVSGWYKARTQRVLFCIALVAAFALNVDTVAICRRLGRDDTLRAALVESAKQYSTFAATHTTTDATASTNETSVGKSMDNLQTEVGHLSGLGLPIGWTYSDQSRPEPDDTDLRCVFSHGWVFTLTKIAGVLLTAFAASLGAPFWFDTLNRLMAVRGTGKSPEEQPKEPKVVLQPQSP
jgi:hypothetical protein